MQNAGTCTDVFTSINSLEIFNETKKQGELLKYIPDELKTYELCLAAVRDDRLPFCDVPDEYKTEEICFAAIEMDSDAINSVPDIFISEELCLTSVEYSTYAIEHIPDTRKTFDICLIAARDSSSVFEYIPDELKAKVQEALDNEKEQSGINYIEKGDLVTNEEGTPCVLESIPHWNNVWLKYEDYVSGKIGSGYDMMGSYYFIAKHEDSRLFRDRGRAHDLWQMRFFTDELTGRDRFLKSLSQYIKTEDKCGNIDGLIAMFLKYNAEDEFMNIKKLDEWYLDPALRRDSLDDMDQCTILIDDWQMQC